MIPEELQAAIDATVPSGTTHIGFVATNIQGDVLVAKPKSPLYGVTATFPKLRILAGEKSNRTLSRCLADSLGQQPLSIYPLRNTWITPNSSSYYFLGLVESQEKPASTDTTDYFWFSPEMAARQFESSDAMSRQRDVAVLAAAQSECASPYRRILLMLRELHQMGFERLRAPAYDYPLAWRCPIVPAAWTLKEHGGKFEDPISGMGSRFHQDLFQYTYSSASGQKPFGWADVAFATPRELAERFIREQPLLTFCGWGPDLAYVQWFEQMLELTAPNGIITAFFADEYGTLNQDGRTLYTHFAPVETVPLSPGGDAEPEQWYDFAQRIKRQQGG